MNGLKNALLHIKQKINAISIGYGYNAKEKKQYLIEHLF